MTNYALVILLLDIFIRAAPELRDWESNVSYVPMLPFYFSFSLRRLLIPSVATSRGLGSWIERLRNPVKAIPPSIISVITQLEVVSSPNSPWAADALLLKTCMAIPPSIREHQQTVIPGTRTDADMYERLGENDSPARNTWRLMLGQH